MEAMFAKKKKKGSKKAFSLNVASSKDVKGAVAPPARRDHDDAAVLHSVVKTAADGQDDGWEDGNEKKKAVSTGGKKVAEVAQSADDEVDWNKYVIENNKKKFAEVRAMAAQKKIDDAKAKAEGPKKPVLKGPGPAVTADKPKIGLGSAMARLAARKAEAGGGGGGLGDGGAPKSGLAALEGSGWGASAAPSGGGRFAGASARYAAGESELGALGSATGPAWAKKRPDTNDTAAFPSLGGAPVASAKTGGAWGSSAPPPAPPPAPPAAAPVEPPPAPAEDDDDGAEESKGGGDDSDDEGAEETKGGD